MTEDLMDCRHYMRLPICGFCNNAWDILFNRAPWDTRSSSRSPGEWVNMCPVGGCDPEIWEFLDEATGDPIRIPRPNNATFHRRSTSDSTAAWRRRWPRVVAAFGARRNSHYEAVVDQKGNVRSRVIPDEDIDWGDEDDGNDQDVGDSIDPIW